MARHYASPTQHEAADGLCGTERTSYRAKRRRRYYAYERRSGSVCYFDKSMHEHLQRYPHTQAHFHLARCLHTSSLLTLEEANRQAWLPRPKRTP